MFSVGAGVGGYLERFNMVLLLLGHLVQLYIMMSVSPRQFAGFLCHA